MALLTWTVMFIARFVVSADPHTLGSPVVGTITRAILVRESSTTGDVALAPITPVKPHTIHCHRDTSTYTYVNFTSHYIKTDELLSNYVTANYLYPERICSHDYTAK